MKEDPQDPFNPAIPADFRLLTQGATEQQKEPGTTTAFSGTKNTKRKSRSGKQTAGCRSKKSRLRWEYLKEKINAKLGGLDRNKLKTALVACGLAAAVVGSICLAVKLVPVAVLLLALVGLVVVIRIWDRLRKGPEPEY
jgi:Flp pilus assembly protein TadB